MEEKRFDEWNIVKKNLHANDKIQNFSEGEIWWCGMGENVGIEINGKSEYFSRPVLVFRKYSRYGFMGIPLTSKLHDDKWHAYFRFHGKDEWAALSQAKTISASRLYKRLGKADETDMAIIKDKFYEILFK